MSGNRWRVDFQLQYPSMETQLDYYWTNCFYYENASSDPYSGDYFSALVNAVHNGTLDTCHRVAIRVTNTTTGHLHSIVTIPWFGAIDSGGEVGSLINTLRLVGMADGRQVSYKLWRIPLLLMDIEGGKVTSTLQAVIQAGVLDVLNSQQFLNVQGVPVEEWVCDWAIHPWQLRHGTKRRTRVVFAYP